MQEFSKYRVITAGIILMFIFVVAAIYTNTKDAAEMKIQQSQALNSEQTVSTDLTTDTQDVAQNSNEFSNSDDINNKILSLKDRIDSLEQTVFSPKNNEDSSAVRCAVKGIIEDEHFVPMSDQDAIKESKENNKEVVITCIFK